MKKLLIACCLALSLFLIGSVSASAATYVYSLDIVITDAGLNTEIESMIGGVEFDVFGGSNGDDWQMIIGDAIPFGEGNWIDLYSGSLTMLFDDYDWETPVFAPMQTGNVLTITSDVALTFSETNFFTFEGMIADSRNFTTDGIVEQSPVPVPSGIVLLGSGLIGLFGLARRKG